MCTYTQLSSGLVLRKNRIELILMNEGLPCNLRIYNYKLIFLSKLIFILSLYMNTYCLKNQPSVCMFVHLIHEYIQWLLWLNMRLWRIL